MGYGTEPESHSGKGFLPSGRGCECTHRQAELESRAGTKCERQHCQYVRMWM